MPIPATSLAFIQNFGPMEIIIILIVALLLFGRKLPEVARNLGKGITEFKRGISDAGEEVKQELNAAADETSKTTEEKKSPEQKDAVKASEAAIEDAPKAK